MIKSFYLNKHQLLIKIINLIIRRMKIANKQINSNLYLENVAIQAAVLYLKQSKRVLKKSKSNLQIKMEA